MHTVILHSENFHVFYTLILYISSEYMFLLSKTTLRYGGFPGDAGGKEPPGNAGD